MPDVLEVFAPQANVNDESVTIVELLVDEGAFVEKDTPLIVVETSKATFDIPSPSSGYIHFLVEVEEDVPIEKPLCILSETLEELTRYVPDSALGADHDQAPYQASASRASSIESYSGNGAVFLAGISSDHTVARQVTISQWLAADESSVLEGQPICRVQDSTNIFELTAPRAGYIKFCGERGDIVPIEKPLCLIGQTVELVNFHIENYQQAMTNSGSVKSFLNTESDRHYSPEEYTNTPRTTVHKTVRISKKARELMVKFSVDESVFASKGLVRSAEVLRFVGMLPSKSRKSSAFSSDTEIKQPGTDMSDDINIVNGVANQDQKLPRTKRTEINLLASAQASAITSQVSILVPTKGIFSACLKNSDFAGQMSSCILFEVSRLLKHYPMLNAGYRSGHIVYYNEINIGYAMDIEQGLKVPVFHRTDDLTLDDIHQKKQELVEKYLLNELSLEELSGGTFTITDLSEQGTAVFNPIINRGQAAILGVGGEQALGQDLIFYPLVIAFDHRLTEGKRSSEFLTELKNRLMAHENLLLRQMGILPDKINMAPKEEPYCQSCFKTASDIYSQKSVLYKTLNNKGEERIICSICAGGW